MSFLEYKIKYVLLVILDNSLAVKKKVRFSLLKSRLQGNNVRSRSRLKTGRLRKSETLRRELGILVYLVPMGRRGGAVL